MTRFEKIHSFNDKIDLAYYLCYLNECPKCPVRFSCRERVNGFITYFEEPDNYDRFILMSLLEMSHFLCDLYEDCNHCPAAYLCDQTSIEMMHGNGFVSWLNKEVTGEPDRNTQIIYQD